MIEKTEWRKSTCGDAQKMTKEGSFIWWRPDGTVFNPANPKPENDVALYADLGGTR